MASLAEMIRQKTNFKPGDSMIGSAIMHPQQALGKLADSFKKDVNTGMGYADEYDNANPLLAPSMEKQAEAGLNLAGLLQGGAFASGAAPKSAGGTLGTFIGKNSTGWDATKADEAEKLLNAGVDPAEVWKAHLIGRMPDKSLFSEISDAEMNHVIPLNKWINKENGQSMAPNISTAWDEAASQLTPQAPVRIKRLFEHEQLKKQYPYGFTKNYENQSIMDLPVFMHEKNSQSSGSLGDGELMLHPSLPPMPAKSTTLHELQHAIQNKEGWARGGSPESAAPFYAQKVIKPQLDDINKQIIKNGNFRDKLTGTEYSDNVSKHHDLVAKRQLLEDELDSLSKNEAPKHSLYRRLTGEAQARATQDRMNMNMVQRRGSYPLANDMLSDIPLGQLIDRYR